MLVIALSLLQFNKQMRLKVRIYNPLVPYQCSKQLVYIPQNIKSIKQVQDHLIDILEIDGDILLRVGQFILPKKESAQILEEGSVIDCYIANQNGKEVEKIKKKKLIIKSSEQSSCSPEVKFKVQKSSKRHKPNSPQMRKKKESSHSSNSSDSSSQSSSQQNKSVPIQRNYNKQITVQLPSKPKQPHAVRQFQSKSQVNQNKLKMSRQSNSYFQKTNQAPKVNQIITEALPTKSISYKPMYNLPQKQSKQHLSFKLVDLSKQFKPKQKYNPLNKLNQQEQAIKPKETTRQITKSIIVNTNNSKQSSIWEQIPMKTVEKYTQIKKKGFLQTGDEIQYQVTEFDEQKYIPVLSQWITASVQETDGKGRITLQPLHKPTKVTLSEINLFGLKLKMEQLKGDRKQFVLAPSAPVENNLQTKSQVLKPEQITNPIVNPTAASQTPQSSKPSKSTELVTQFNYYFGDENYNKDNYLLMHASKHKQLYIPLKCFMNFNKLKPLVSNQGELESILRSADLSNSNFELHPQNKLVRKKGILHPL